MDKFVAITNAPHIVAQIGYTHGYNPKPRPILHGPRTPCLQRGRMPGTARNVRGDYGLALERHNFLEMKD